MCKTWLRRLSTLALVSASACGCALHAGAEGLSPPVGQSVLPDGDFEAADDEGKPFGWTFPPPFKDSDVLPAELRGDSSNHYVRLNNPGAVDAVRVTRTIPLNPVWRSVEVSARLRAVRLQPMPRSSRLGGATIKVTFRSENNTTAPVPALPAFPWLRKQSGWVTLRVANRIPRGTDRLELALTLSGATGSADFDDVRVVPDPPIGKASHDR